MKAFDPTDPVQLRSAIHHYRHKLRVGPKRTAADQIAEDAVEAELHREKTSHRGIGTRRRLRALAAGAVNQDFLDEIGELAELEHLDLRWPMRATDLAPLRRLAKLRVLQIDSPSKITDFTPILDLPALKVLMIENAQHLYELDWMRPLKDRLEVLGIEGSVNRDQRVASLAPLEGFAIEALFMVSVMLKDRSVAPLRTCPNLRMFYGTRFAPKADFQALEAARPGLYCNWFDWDSW